MTRALSGGGTAALLLAAALGAPAAARAQSTGNGFLFGRPGAILSVRAGFAHASASSDLFDFTTKQLTVNRSDFSSFTVSGGLGFLLGERFQLDLDAGYARSNTPSEFRNFVDQNNLPIQQTTTFQRVPLTASLKAYLVPQGRSVGLFAWVPSGVAPYVGVGGGALWYRFHQEGDFVDFTNNNVFTAQLESSGWTPEAHAMAGVDFTVTPRVVLTVDGRYSWANAKPSADFSGFQHIDLSGFTVTGGVGIRF